jgi:hypothetical protein
VDTLRTCGLDESKEFYNKTHGGLYTAVRVYADGKRLTYPESDKLMFNRTYGEDYRIKPGTTQAERDYYYTRRTARSIA